MQPASSTRICDAQLGIEVGQRLVEQEDLGLAHDGAADGDALALAAGKRLGLALQIVRPVAASRPAPPPAARSRPSAPMFSSAKAMFSATLICG
jgi:hypothetical protein